MAEDRRSGRRDPVIEVSTNGSATVVRLTGELDLYNAHQVRSVLVRAAEEEPERLVVDLAGVDFIDSTGLGVLVEARARLSNRESFMLAAPGLETRRALSVSGLDRHFAVHDTLEGALETDG